uniref:Uncharacterized protein n=1 Tax=Oryza brachyantha TaxID=4533 RepID=J3LE43_ORYBR
MASSDSGGGSGKQRGPSDGHEGGVPRSLVRGRILQEEMKLSATQMHTLRGAKPALAIPEMSAAAAVRAAAAAERV